MFSRELKSIPEPEAPADGLQNSIYTPLLPKPPTPIVAEAPLPPTRKFWDRFLLESDTRLSIASSTSVADSGYELNIG